MIDWKKPVECDEYGLARRVEQHADSNDWKVFFERVWYNYSPSGHFLGAEGDSTRKLRNVAESAGLKGFVPVYDYRGDRDPSVLSGIFEHSNCFAETNEGHRLLCTIDLSKITNDQLVEPEQKRETKKLTIAFWDDGSQTLEKNIDRYRGHRLESRLNAIKEVDVDYIHGEGLDKDR